MAPLKPTSDKVRIEVEVVRGEKLRVKDMLSRSSDPYVVVYPKGEEDKKQKTPVVKKSLAPEWNCDNIFEFEVKDNQSIIIECWDWDKFSKDDPMGSGKLVPFLAAKNDWPEDGTERVALDHGREGYIHVRARARPLDESQVRLQGSRCGKWLLDNGFEGEELTVPGLFRAISEAHFRMYDEFIEEVVEKATDSVPESFIRSMGTMHEKAMKHMAGEVQRGFDQGAEADGVDSTSKDAVTEYLTRIEDNEIWSIMYFISSVPADNALETKVTPFVNGMVKLTEMWPGYKKQGPDEI